MCECILHIVMLEPLLMSTLCASFCVTADNTLHLDVHYVLRLFSALSLCKCPSLSNSALHSPQWSHVARHAECVGVLPVVLDQSGATSDLWGGGSLHQDEGLVVQTRVGLDEVLA